MKHISMKGRMDNNCEMNFLLKFEHYQQGLIQFKQCLERQCPSLAPECFEKAGVCSLKTNQLLLAKEYYTTALKMHRLNPWQVWQTACSNQAPQPFEA